MADRTIDFGKVDAAFQHLAADHSTLAHLGQTIDDLHSKLQPQLNDFEFKFLVTNLLNQRSVGTAVASSTPTRKVLTHGFVIKTAVEAD